MRWCLNFLREQDGATAVEYAVLLALILLAIITSVQAVGAQSGGMWGGTKASLDSVGFGGS